MYRDPRCRRALALALAIRIIPHAAGAPLVFLTPRQTANNIPNPDEGQSQSQIPSRSQSDGQDQNGGIAPQVWVPALIVVLILLAAFCFVWTRASVRSRLRTMASRATQRNTTPGTREVTASQLVGSTAASNNNGNGNGNTTGTGRRAPRAPRRNRRTPSQMSTTSLPVYMKEPGDQELVIFRGPEEMDASEAIAEAQEAEDASADGHGESSQEHGHGDEHELEGERGGLLNPNAGAGRDDRDHAGPMASMPALHDDDVGNDTTVSADFDPSIGADASTAALLARQTSHDTGDSHSLLMRQRPTSDASSVPSDAPPEYQAEYELEMRQRVPPGLAGSSSPTASVSAPSPSPPATPESARTHARAHRRSRLVSRVSNILHLRNTSSISSSASMMRSGGVMTPEPRLSSIDGMPMPMPAGTGAPGTNPAAAASYVTLNDPPPFPGSASASAPSPSPGAQHTRHRSSQSGSGSTLGLSLPFRTLSRQRSTTTLASAASRSNAHLPALTSPSTLSLSLASGALTVSAPLPHTLTRTEIRYPRGGPTAEQIRLISSRESLGRFGVPYGREAVEHAYAQSQSRLELALEEGDGHGEGEGGEGAGGEDPPPVFESPAGEVGPSAARGGEGEDPDALPRSSNSDTGANGTSSESATNPGASSHERTQSERSRRQQETAAAIDSARILVPIFM